MDNKRRCTNCGAYLNENDKVCYVCGEVQLPEVVMSERTADDVVECPAYNFTENEDYVVPESVTHQDKPVDIEEVNYGDDFDEAVSYDEEYYPEQSRRMREYSDEVAEPYYEGDRRREKLQKKHRKTTAIVITIIVAVLLIAGGVVFAFVSGIFGPKKPAVEGKKTIYFDKPSAEIELTAQDGTTYNWSGDVVVTYKLNGKTRKTACTPCIDHETLWKVNISDKAEKIYFYQATDKKVRTQNLPSFNEETVYYVSQKQFNRDNQLPLGECARDNFEGIGVNYATDPTSEPETETTTAEQTTAETTAETSETEETSSSSSGEPYSVSVPSAWADDVSSVQNGNCTIYYEDYNHDMYEMGTLVSIYVFDADDSKADNLDGVKLTEYTSDKSKKIVVTTPTDVQYNDADDTAVKNYMNMQKEVNNFISSIVIN